MQTSIISPRSVEIRAFQISKELIKQLIFDIIDLVFQSLCKKNVFFLGPSRLAPLFGTFYVRYGTAPRAGQVKSIFVCKFL